MNWEDLLCSDRIHDSDPAKTKEKSKKKESDPRSEFEKDVHRIFFTHPFRRLQNKTQVIPVPVFDFIHTRLTHSLEVASVGRVLGRIAGGKIIKKYELKEFTEYDFGAIVQAACLAHDIGNPPFGHSGERSIQDCIIHSDFYDTYAPFFMELPGIEDIKLKELSEKHWRDFMNFEGNAMGFRSINKEQYRGFNLTCATLATFTKYPRESYIDPKCPDFIWKEKKLVPDPQDKDKTLRISQKKYGFFQAEKEIFKKVATKTELIPLGDEKNWSWCRHPLAFLMEAADDICYTLIDLEDGFRLGRISYDFAKEKLEKIADIDNYEVFNKLVDDDERIGYLRGKAIFKLVYAVAKKFEDLEGKILKGNHDNALINSIGQIEIIKEIREKIKAKVYNYKPILELVAVGSAVLRGLVNLFVNAATPQIKVEIDTSSKIQESEYEYNKLIKKLIPKQFLATEEERERGVDYHLYISILKIMDYVSGMTDNYALQLYRKLKGIEVPHLQNLSR